MKDKINKILPDSRIGKLLFTKFGLIENNIVKTTSFDVAVEIRQILIDELEGEFPFDEIIETVEELRDIDALKLQNTSLIIFVNKPKQ